MKIIIAGGTGLIGGAALRQLLASQNVTEVVALSRRELGIKDPKLQTVIVKNFLKYEDGELEQLKGAEGCIWALGSPQSGREVHYDYTLAIIDALSTRVVPDLTPGKEFRFIYTSGGAVETDQSKTLFFLGGVRKMRGDLQTKVIEFKQPETAATGGTWKSFTVRPNLVTTGVPLFGLLPGRVFIPKDELGAAMASLAQNGADKQVFDNVELRQIGKEVLETTEA